MRRFQAVVLTLSVALCATARAEEEKSVRERIRERGWNLKFQDFCVGGFVGPSVVDAEYRLYKEGGFNVVITPRRLHYNENGETPEDGYKRVDGALDLAQKHGLAVVLETYAHKHTAWGGVDAPDGHHHPATVPELEFIIKRFGKHPALIGCMLADDIGHPPPNVCESSKWMLKNTPHLWPWMCQLANKPGSIAINAKGMSGIPQLYPTLYKIHSPFEAQMKMYCEQLDTLRRGCLDSALLPQPMFNVSKYKGRWLNDDSVLRFQIYSSLAYGAQGIWYFTYNGYGSLFEGKSCDDSYLAAKALCDLKWYVCREGNHRVLAWGPELVGTECREICHSRWGMWNEKDEAEKALKPGESNITGSGKLVAKMPDDLLVGILRKKNAPPLAMVVDKRVADGFRSVKPRTVDVTFADDVKSIEILEAGGSTVVKGSTVRLNLEGGGGQLIRLSDRADVAGKPANVDLPKRIHTLDLKPEMFTGRWTTSYKLVGYEGHWRSVPMQRTLTMKADGTFELNNGKGNLMDTGTWSIRDKQIHWTFKEAPFPDGYATQLLAYALGEFVLMEDLALRHRDYDRARITIFTRDSDSGGAR